MGNSSTSDSKQHQSHNHNQHESHHFNLKHSFDFLHLHGHKKKNSALDDVDWAVVLLFQRLDISDSNETMSLAMFLKAYFSNSFLLKKLIINSLGHDIKCIDDSDIQVNVVKLKILIDYIYKHSATNVFDFYIEMLFQKADYKGEDIMLEYSEIERLLQDCFMFTIESAMSLSNSNETQNNECKLINNASTRQTLDSILNSIQFSSSNETEMSSKVINHNKFKEWVTYEFPKLFNGFHNWFIQRVKTGAQTDKTASEKVAKLELSDLMNTCVLWYLVSNLPSCYLKNLSTENCTVIERIHNALYDGNWKRLYSSEVHGLSLNRFQSSLANYKAPTILFLYCESGNLYCVCSNVEYRESPMPYGDTQTKVFRLWKNFKLFEINENDIYLNTKSRLLKLGLIIGYSKLKPVIKVDEHFQHIEHYVETIADDETTSCLVKDKIFQIEVYGCGSMKSTLDQEDMRKWEQKNLEKMRKVNLKAGDWNENADKNILDLAGIQTSHAERSDI